MEINLNKLLHTGETVAVACSGGSDSMALLHYMQSVKEKYQIKIVCVNIEHGIRGESSIKDSAFVKDYCNAHSIPLKSVSVDSLSLAKSKGVPVEVAARELRYSVFFDCIESGFCNKVATAHHQSDNAESVLINLLRGSGLKGVSGIEESFNDKIIRPFLRVSKTEINDYISKNGVPYITDESNFSTDYTRNFLRLKVIPLLKEVFPETEKNIERFSLIAKEENEYIENAVCDFLTEDNGTYKININTPSAVFKRAVIKALKYLGVEKDWEKTHIDQVYSLCLSNNATKIDLPKGVVAIKEYDNIVLYLEKSFCFAPIPFCTGEFKVLDKTITVKKIDKPIDLKNGLFIATEKLPNGTVIRLKKDGDKFTKFGGGTKSLSDYFTDLKIPLKDRQTIPLIAKDDTVYAIFGIAVSNLVKAEDSTKTVYQLEIK